MRKIVIDGNNMRTKEEMHDYLKQVFDLPYYYARNLDSLYQILVKEDEPTLVVMNNKKSIAAGYGEALAVLFKDLSSKNNNYSFQVNE